MDTSFNGKIHGGANEQRAEGSGVRDPLPAPVDRAPSSDSRAQASGQHCVQGRYTGVQVEMGQFTPIPPPTTIQGRETSPASKQKATRSLCLLDLFCADL